MLDDLDYARCRRDAKTAWLGLPASEQKKLKIMIEEETTLDGVLRMKMAVKLRAVKGKFTASGMKQFYEDLDAWISEMTSKDRGDFVEPTLSYMEKAILIKFARDVSD